MDFKIVIVLLLLFTSCQRAADAWNEVRVKNDTDDTISIVFKRIGGTDNGRVYTVVPKEVHLLSRASYASDYEIIADAWGREGDTAKFYRNGSLFKTWIAPLQDLPDSIHSFYNRNSWIIEEGGRKDKFVLATFTIINDDFEYD
jgi:hypothetical protein